MENLSKFVASRLALRQRRVTDHPDADVLAAFAEGGLLPRERTSVLGHLAGCPECREVLALTATGEGSKGQSAPSKVRQETAPWRWPWIAALATTCLVVAVVWHPSFVREHSERPAVPSATAAPPVDLPQVMEAQKPKAEAAAKEKITQHEPSKKIVARAASAPMVKQKAEDAATEDKRADSDIVIREAQSAPPPALPAPQPASVQNFAPSAQSQFRSKRVTAPGGESNLWRLPESAGGTVQRSKDGGKTWADVRIDDRSRFYALAATDAEVWVAGAGGALFHSIDKGSHWVPVVVSDGENRLTDAITRIDVRDEKIILLRTQAGSSWVTLDGGLHWRLEQ